MTGMVGSTCPECKVGDDVITPRTLTDQTHDEAELAMALAGLPLVSATG